MDTRSLKRIDSAGAAARLLLVVAALAGFLAMHGLATTDSAGAHHLVSTGIGVVQHDDSDAMAVLRAAPAQDPAEHNAMMAGCVFILMGLAGAIALRARWVSAAERASLRGAGRVLSHGAPRAPPCPVFLALCVFRL